MPEGRDAPSLDDEPDPYDAIEWPKRGDATLSYSSGVFDARDGKPPRGSSCEYQDGYVAGMRERAPAPAIDKALSRPIGEEARSNDAVERLTAAALSNLRQKYINIGRLTAYDLKLAAEYGVRAALAAYPEQGVPVKSQEPLNAASMGGLMEVLDDRRLDCVDRVIKARDLLTRLQSTASCPAEGGEG